MLLTQSILCGLFGPFYHAVSLKSTLHSVLNSVLALMKMDLHVYSYIAHCTYNVAIPTDREFTSPSRYAISMVARASSSLGVTCLGDPLVKLEYPTSLSNTN